MAVEATRSGSTLRAAPGLIGLGVTVLLLAVSGRYGHHRDEFYYLAAGRRFALGYVDHPPLTPWLARLQVDLFGDGPTAMRVVPAIAVGLTVVLAGRIAREPGGDRTAAAVAATAVAGAAFPIATGHMLSTSTIDLLAWTALSWLLVRALRDGGRICRSLPAEQRVATVVLASNYGEAGAVELLGAPTGLPPAYSGHNSYGAWGPPPETATTVVAVGYDEATLRRWFASVRVVGRIENEARLQNDERGQPVAVATNRLDTWERLWPHLGRLA